MVDEGQDPKVRPSPSEILDDLMDWGGKVFQKVRKEADTLSTRGRLRLDLASLKSKRGAEFKKLGMKVYHLMEHGRIEVPGTETNVAAIEELTKQIRDRERQLEDSGQDSETEVASAEQIEENSKDI